MRNYITTYRSPFDSLFNAVFAPDLVRENAYSKGLLMRTDIEETENGYTLDVELPGIKKENISVSYEDGYLTVEAKAEENSENKENNSYVRRERFLGTSSRSYYLGELDEENIEASYSDGILHVVANRKVEKPEEKVRKISIK